MKTYLNEETYLIRGVDKSGLIPKEAVGAVIFYDQGEPVSVNFIPKMILTPRVTSNYKPKLEKIVKQTKTLIKVHEKLNPPRTREEIKKIVNVLEASLEKYN